MLAITNSVTPENLNKRFLPPKPVDAGEIIKKNEVLQTRNQMVRPKKNFYMSQTPQINKALLNG